MYGGRTAWRGRILARQGLMSPICGECSVDDGWVAGSTSIMTARFVRQGRARWEKVTRKEVSPGQMRPLSTTVNKPSFLFTNTLHLREAGNTVRCGGKRMIPRTDRR